MSRQTFYLANTTKILDREVNAIAIGRDHMSGYFIQGYLNGNMVLDRDEMGHGSCGSDGATPITLDEIREILSENYQVLKGTP